MNPEVLQVPFDCTRLMPRIIIITNDRNWFYYLSLVRFPFHLIMFLLMLKSSYVCVSGFIFGNKWLHNSHMKGPYMDLLIRQMEVGYY